MATQFGEECWCSRLDDLDFDSHGAGECDIYCTGDNVRSLDGWRARCLSLCFTYASVSLSLSKPETIDEEGPLMPSLTSLLGGGL